MKDMAILIDGTNCIACKACIAACKQENGLATGNNYLKILPKEFIRNQYTRYFAHTSCRHCNEPQCEVACPVGAIKRNEDGIVVHDELKCVGCQVCAAVCSHSAIRIMNNGLVGKCNMCKERLSSGLSPACVTICPTKARIYDTRDNIIKIAKERQAELQNGGYETQIDGICNEKKILTIVPKC